MPIHPCSGFTHPNASPIPARYSAAPESRDGIALAAVKRIVLIAGFEAFNAGLYRRAAQQAMARCPGLTIAVFSDRDLTDRPQEVDAALEGADAFFASLIFDFDQVGWLRPRIEAIPIRLVFESAIELMGLTRLGRFTIGGSSAGMPKPVQALLAKFGSGREEDKLAGYIGFLKVGPKLLRFVPSRKVQDLRHWLIIYGYWNAGGTDNVTALFLYLARHGLGLSPVRSPHRWKRPTSACCTPITRVTSSRRGATWNGFTVSGPPAPATGPWWGCCSIASM